METPQHSVVDLELNTYYDIPEETYHRLDLISFHGLLSCFKSYEHFKTKKFSNLDSQTLRFGRIAHIMALEPDRFADIVKPYPEMDLRTKAGKEASAAFRETLKESDIPVSNDDFIKLMGMRNKLNEINNIDSLSWIFQKKERVETSVFFNLAASNESDDSEIISKSRIDLIGDDFILDYKTTRDASPESFQFDIIKYKYDAQLFYYQHAESMVSGKLKSLFILAQEVEPPFEFVLYEVSHASHSSCWSLINKGLSNYIRGLNSIDGGYSREIIQARERY